MRTLLFALLFALSVTPTQDAQAPRELRILQKDPIQGVAAAPVMGPLRCGSNGSVYLRIPLDDQDILNSPVFAVTPDGKQHTTFSVRESPGLDKASLVDYSPASDGTVWMLALDQDQKFYLVHFGEKGKFIAKNALQEALHPARIAAFDTGELLLTGNEDSPPVGTEPTVQKPFTAIISSRGQLAYRVFLPGDIQPAASTSGDEKARRTAQRNYERALSLSFVDRVDPGRVFLARYAAQSPIYILNRAGEMRAIPAEVPQGTHLTDVKADGSSLLLMYARYAKDGPPPAGQMTEVIFQVWNIETGEMMTKFSHNSPEIGAGLACFRSGILTFVTMSMEGDKILLVRTAP